MNIKIGIATMLLLFGSKLYAQTHPIDYINCKAVELSLKKNSPEDWEKFKSLCDCSTNPQFGIIRNAIPANFRSTVSLANEIESIKSDFEKIPRNDQLKFITTSIYNDSVRYTKLFSFKKNRLNDNSFNNFIFDLEKSLPVILSTYHEQTQTGIETENGGKINTVEGTADGGQRGTLIVEEQAQQGFQGITYEIDAIAIILTLITLSLLFYKLNETTGLIKELKSEIREYKSQFNQLFTKPRDSKSSTLVGTNIDDEIASLRNQIAKLRGELSLLKETKVNDSSSDSVEALSKSKTDTLPIQPAEVLFGSIPDADGFNTYSVSDYFKPSASIYRIEKRDMNRASFTIEDRLEAMQLALQFPRENIEPVCEVLNAYNSRVKRVVSVDKPGMLELQGNKWVVKSKLKVRYE